MSLAELVTDPAYVKSFTHAGYEEQLRSDFELVLDGIEECQAGSEPLDDIFLVTTAQKRLAKAQAEYNYPDPFPIEGISPTLRTSIRIVRAITGLHAYLEEPRAETGQTSFDNGLAAKESALIMAVIMELGRVKVNYDPRRDMSAAEADIERKLRQELGISTHPSTPLPTAARFLMDNLTQVEK